LTKQRLLTPDSLKDWNVAGMKLHFLEKKYGIRINLLDWSGDDYEAGTLNALIKIDRSDAGRILLEGIAYHVKHNPGNLAHGIVEIRPYAQGDCNGSSDPDLTNKRGQQLEPVVHFWPKAFARGGACSKYLEDHREEIGGILPDEALFHELVHAFRMASGKSTDATQLRSLGADYQIMTMKKNSLPSW
jgi:hypothetical protein